MANYLLDTNHLSPLVTIAHPLRQRVLQSMRVGDIFTLAVPALAELQISLRRRGWQLATVDALIAAVAIRYDLILLTTDKDFRAIPKLKRQNWLGNQ